MYATMPSKSYEGNEAGYRVSNGVGRKTFSDRAATSVSEGEVQGDLATHYT